MTANNRRLVMILELITKFPSVFPARYWGTIRSIILLSFDLLIVFLTYFAAFQLRFEAVTIGDHLDMFWDTYWVYLIAYAVTFQLTGMYRQIWRYANFRNAILIVFSTFTACVVSMLVIYFINNHIGYPRSVSIIVWSLSTIAIGFLRFSWRGINNLKTRIAKSETEHCFIYGAGGSGELLARYIRENAKLPYKVIGFIDDNRKKMGRQIHGYRIIGTGEDLPRLAKEHAVTYVLIAMNSLPGKVIREIVARCQKIGLKTLILPEISDSDDSASLRPRQIDVKDLLRRSQKSIDNSAISTFFHGKTVLVTGAGGTIGSEISRQILATAPKKLLLLDNCELSLYTLENALTHSNKGKTEIAYLMASVTDHRMIDRIFADQNVDCVLHAAAYKHVHLVEANPVAGITNNVYGTKVVVDAVLKYNVKHFLLISSDKAVRPTGIMGKTKRVCELYLQAMNQKYGNRCKFCSVRFGNVLGSSGSVIPRFLDQIASGGPVTITHPDMTRYFMLVNEAVSLVLQSLIQTQGGEIFVLKMGDPVNIYEMAKQLIVLAGKKVGEDIDIVLTGLRPGEKLFEELSYEGSENRTEDEDIFIVRSPYYDLDAILLEIEQLLTLSRNGHAVAAKSILDQIVQDSYDPKISTLRVESSEESVVRPKHAAAFSSFPIQ